MTHRVFQTTTDPARTLEMKFCEQANRCLVRPRDDEARWKLTI